MQVDAILREVVTRVDVQRLMDELVVLERWMASPVEQRDEHVLLSGVRESIAALMQQPAMMEKDARVQQQWLQGLKERVLALPEVQVTMAFQPSRRFLEQVAQAVRAATGTDVVLDCRFDPTIMGGAVIHYRGKVWEGTIKALFDAQNDEQAGYIRERLAT